MSALWFRAAWLGASLIVALSLLARAAPESTAESEVDLTLAHVLPTLTNSIGMKFVKVPRGKFVMGACRYDEAAKAYEKPAHEVEITKDFYLGTYEVTQKQYRAVMGYNPSYFSEDGKGNGDGYHARPAGGKDKVKGLDTSDFPVENVSWNDATDFLKRLGDLDAEKKAGRVYCLPTEAEWERACRDRDARPSLFHYGDALTSRHANFNGGQPGGRGEKGEWLARTCKVGSYRPNAFGLYDMHGNVWEWCADWYAEGYYAESLKKDPQGPLKPDLANPRVHRGGGWEADGCDCRSSARSRSTYSVRNVAFGIRAVVTMRRE